MTPGVGSAGSAPENGQDKKKRSSQGEKKRIELLVAYDGPHYCVWQIQ